MPNHPRDTSAIGSHSVAICGNPNCGKTTVFNAITGLHQRVGNYPGVTVDKTSGQFRIDGHPDEVYTLTDVPGSYSLSAFSPDEYIATRALCGSLADQNPPDVIVCLIDATNLERGLYLLFQVMQIGRPLVVGLNMVDLLQRRGMRIDYEELSRRLGGVPVVPMVGSRGKGIDRLKREVARTIAHPMVVDLDLNDASVERAVETLMAAGRSRGRSKAEYLRVLFDVDGPAEQEFLQREGSDTARVIKKARIAIVEEHGSLTAAETLAYTRRASSIHEAVVQQLERPGRSFSHEMDKVLLHNVFGPVILIVLMTLMFQSVFSWAEPLMNLIDGAFGSLAVMVEGSMADGPLRSLITDGVIGGVGSVLIFLPQIMILFLYIAVLEDSGYMPRAAFIVDRAFRWCGLSGKSFIPMLSSFACAVPGIMATRTIEDRKLRLITIMVAPLMTCSARLPVYTIMIAAFIPHKTYLGLFNSQGLVLTSLYLLGIISAVIVSLVLKKAFFKTERGTFMMEMPSYKLPTLQSVVIRVLNRAKSFLLRAGTVIMAITVVVWALGYYPRSGETVSSFEVEQVRVARSFEGRMADLQGEIAATPGVSVRPGVISDRLAVAATVDELSVFEEELFGRYPADSALVRLLVRQQRLELDRQARLHVLADREAGALLRESYLARLGRTLEPVFRPLGWDWRITMAVLSALPAREIVIATIGTTFNLGGEVDETSASLVDKLRTATWDSGPRLGTPLFSPAVALSIMIFFALCCQCGATVVTIRQEAGGWSYALLVFGYMTLLAYLGALVTFNLFSWMGF